MTKTKKKKIREWIVLDCFYYLQRHWNHCLLFQVQLRGEILKQLRELKDLKDADVLDSIQFEAQKKLLLTELNELHWGLLFFYLAVTNLLLLSIINYY